MFDSVPHHCMWHPLSVICPNVACRSSLHSVPIVSVSPRLSYFSSLNSQASPSVISRHQAPTVQPSRCICGHAWANEDVPGLSNTRSKWTHILQQITRCSWRTYIVHSCLSRASSNHMLCSVVGEAFSPREPDTLLRGHQTPPTGEVDTTHC